MVGEGSHRKRRFSLVHVRALEKMTLTKGVERECAKVKTPP